MNDSSEEYSFRRTSRLQRIFRAFLKAIVPLLFFAALGLFVLYLDLSGAFIRWENLGKPPEEIRSIRRVSCFFSYIETKDGKIYTYSDWSPEWQLTTVSEIPNEAKAYVWNYRRAPSRSDTVQLKDFSTLIHETICYTAFALRSDGNIYRWAHKRHALIFLFKSFAYPTIGLVLGAGIMTILDQRKADRKRIKE